MIIWKITPFNSMQQIPIVWRRLENNTEESCLITAIKEQINADEAELLDADGNLMTAEQAKTYVATLP